MKIKEQNSCAVKTTDVDGKKLELTVIKPTNKIAQEANMAYKLKVSSLIRNGGGDGDRLLLRSEVEEYLLKAEIWTPSDAYKMEQLGFRIKACEIALKKGGIKLLAARRLAIMMGDLRNEMLELYNKRQQLDSACVESIAENYRFDILVTKCVLRSDTGTPYFGDYDDYIKRGNEDAAMDGAMALAQMLYGLEHDVKINLFENKWLKEAGFMNKEGRYTDRSGRYIDKTGKLIDEEGRYVDDGGNFVTSTGQKVDLDGSLFVPEQKPYIDDETGKEVSVCVVGEDLEVLATKKKKKRKKTIKKSKTQKKT